jgi:hypothetical protein
MLGSQLGIFLFLILFKQLLSDKIFLEQENKLIRNSFIRIDHNFLFGLRKGVYHIFEFISS